jgi:tetratricopeptide (TPR) repeat protein
MACYEKAIAAFEKARTLAPQDKTFLLPLASSYDSIGRFAEAEWIWDEALRLDPRSTSLNGPYQAHLNRWRNAGTSDRRGTDSAPPGQ